MNWELDWLNPSLKKHTHTHTLANRKLHELWARFRIDSHWYNFARLWTKKIEDMNQEGLGLFSRLPSTPVMSGKMCQRRTGYELGGLLSLLVYGAEVFWILQKVSYTWHLCIIFNIIYIIITLQVVLRNWKTEVNIVTCLEDLISFLPISWSVIGPRCDIASGLNYLHAEVWGADRVLATCSWFCHIMWPMLAIDSGAHPKLFRDLNSGRGIIIIFPAIAI